MMFPNPAKPAACLMLLLSLAARADNGEIPLSPAPDDAGYPGKATEISVGLAGGYANGGYKNYSGTSSVSPVLEIESRRFYVRGLSAGVKLYSAPNQSQELLLGATYLRQYRFKQDKSKDAQIKRLKETLLLMGRDPPYALKRQPRRQPSPPLRPSAGKGRGGGGGSQNRLAATPQTFPQRQQPPP